jgi:hypothetical protein
MKPVQNALAGIADKRRSRFNIATRVGEESHVDQRESLPCSIKLEMRSLPSSTSV